MPQFPLVQSTWHSYGVSLARLNNTDLKHMPHTFSGASSWGCSTQSRLFQIVYRIPISRAICSYNLFSCELRFCKTTLQRSDNLKKKSFLISLVHRWCGVCFCSTVGDYHLSPEFGLRERNTFVTCIVRPTGFSENNVSRVCKCWKSS